MVIWPPTMRETALWFRVSKMEIFYEELEDTSELKIKEANVS